MSELGLSPGERMLDALNRGGYRVLGNIVFGGYTGKIIGKTDEGCRVVPLYAEDNVAEVEWLKSYCEEAGIILDFDDLRIDEKRRVISELRKGAEE